RSAAPASLVSPMNRRVKWKLPGSTHFAPGTPEHSSDNWSLSSGGKPIPTNRRSIASTCDPPAPSNPSSEQSEDAGVAIKTIARDLAIGKEPDQRELAQGFADHPRLRPGITKQGRAASNAADIYPGFWGSVQPAGELPDHAAHVTLRTLGIAAAE